MSKSVDLPDTVFAALEAAATATGITPAEWVAAQLPRPVSSSAAPRSAKVPRPRWDEFAGRMGLVSNGLADPDEPGTVVKRRARPPLHRVTALVCAVDLPDPVYVALEDAACAVETTPAGWIAANLPSRGQISESQRDGMKPRTLAERLEGLIGVVSLERSDLAERHSELFAEGMVEKHRQGRL